MSHPPILETRQLLWPNEAACASFAAELAARPQAQDAVLELDGPLGAGKTTFVRHLLRALGVKGRIKSPTYAVVEPHQGSLSGGRLFEISHFDFYRFTDAREWEDAGFRDLFAAPGLKLCEWAEKARPVLPLPDLRLLIEPIDFDAPPGSEPDAAAGGSSLWPSAATGCEDPTEAGVRRVWVSALTAKGQSWLRG